MSDNDPNNTQAAAASDPPIIIQGGNSVEVDVPDGFTAELSSTSGNGKKFKNGNVHLYSLQINTNTPIQLNKGDRITITYK
jgi:hypothetical protein